MLISLLLIPLIGSIILLLVPENSPKNIEKMRVIAIVTSLVNFFISILIWIKFDSSVIDYQFVSEFNQIGRAHV